MAKIVIGIDQSYKNCGWSICKNNKIIKYGNINYEGAKTNSNKRKILYNIINQLIKYCLSEVKSDPHKIIIVFERIRLYSHGFLSMNYIVNTAALIAVLIDAAYDNDIKCYSVDTRSWKSQIVGSSKGKKKKVLITKGKNKGKYKTTTDNKSDTLKYVKNVLLINTNGDDDIADAICISKYPFLPKAQIKLKLET